MLIKKKKLSRTGFKMRNVTLHDMLGWLGLFSFYNNIKQTSHNTYKIFRKIILKAFK